MATPKPAVDPAEFRSLEARVKALEDLRTKVEGAALVIKVAWALVGATVLAVLGGGVAVVWRYATDSAMIAQHEKSIAELRAQHDKAIADVQRTAKETDDQLRFWEKRAFRAPVQAFFRDGEVVALKGDKLTVHYQDDDDKPVTSTFTVDPTMKVEVKGKQVSLGDAGLRPGTPISFMIGEDPGRITSLRVESKK